MQKNTNVQQLLADLHGGILEKKLAHVLSQAAIAAINPVGSGSATVSLTFKLTKISQGRECKMEHSVGYRIPTENGEKAEKDTTNTIVYVNEGGNITIIPEAQSNFMFDQKGE